MIYDYQVIPAPSRGLKAKGVKTTEARFAYAIQDVLNRMAAEGLEFQRAETLPSSERAGLTSTTTVYRNVLVFRRPATGADVAPPADPAPILPMMPDSDPDPQAEGDPPLSPDTATNSAPRA
jgi:hypothetical protein